MSSCSGWLMLSMAAKKSTASSTSICSTSPMLLPRQVTASVSGLKRAPSRTNPHHFPRSRAVGRKTRESTKWAYCARRGNSLRVGGRPVQHNVEQPIAGGLEADLLEAEVLPTKPCPLGQSRHSLGLSCARPVLTRSQAKLAFERPREIREVVEADGVGDFLGQCA